MHWLNAWAKSKDLQLSHLKLLIFNKNLMTGRKIGAVGILNREELKARMQEQDYTKKLVVTPLLSEKQIGPASIDVRLGSTIIIMRKTYVEKQDMTNRVIARQAERRLYERKTLRLHSKFMLHPNQLIL